MYGLVGHGRMPLVTDQSVVVTKNHIDKVVGSLERDGQFGKDNRAGFPGKLHRVSVMRDKVCPIVYLNVRCRDRWCMGDAPFLSLIKTCDRSC